MHSTRRLLITSSQRRSSLDTTPKFAPLITTERRSSTKLPEQLYKKCSFVWNTQKVANLHRHSICSTRTLYQKASMGREHANTSRLLANPPTITLQKSTGKAGYHTDLPKLGVPPLEQTIAKLVHFAKPIQAPNEYKETLKQAKEFLRNEKAIKLHELLEARAKHLPNWLTPWWLNVAYLEARTPLPIVTSPGIGLEKFPFYGEDGQLEYAAKIISSVLQYHQAILSKSLKQDGTPKMPFDMSQYDNLIGTTRIPRRGQDEIIYGHQRKSSHIYLTRNGHTFWFPVYDKAGNPLGVNQIVELIRREVLPKSQERNNNPVNLVTAVGRDEWADVYKRLERSNPKLIESYKDALFILCLDKTVDLKPGQDREDILMHQALLGGGSQENAINRWFDKTVQLFLNTSGDIGCTYEHTPAEGPPVANLLDFLQKKLKENKFLNQTSSEAVHGLYKLEWSLNEADCKTIEEAIKQVDKAAADIEVKSLNFRNFGKDVPKAAKLSPDSFIQLAFQVAFYRLHGKHPPTYETATLRQFKDGRTDTIRLPNHESAAFVEAFAGQVNGLPVSEQCELFVKAVEAHKKYSVAAMNGHGMDRHILGLKLIASEHAIPLPSLLKGDALRKLLHFQVSTSQVPTESETKMGFGPSELDCYGCCYNPRENQMFFTVTAYNSCNETSARRFAEELSRALDDFKQMLSDSGRLSNGSKL